MVAAGGPALKAGDPATDAERRSALRRMKMVATGFLVVAGVIYLVAEYARHNGGNTVVFADGHAKWMSQGQMDIDPARQAEKREHRWKLIVDPNDPRMNQ